MGLPLFLAVIYMIMAIRALATGARNATGLEDAGFSVDDPQVDYFDPDWHLWVDLLGWETFRAEMEEDTSLRLFWKGVELTPEGGLLTPFNQIPGRVVFGGRTGGSWQTHHVDNLKVGVLPANDIIIGAVTGTLTGFTFPILISYERQG